MLIDTICNKLFLITGGTSGIGLEVVKILKLNGANLIVLGRNFEKVRVFLDDNDICLNLDFSNLGWLEELEEFRSLNIRLDGFVHAAGISELKPFQFFNFEQHNKINNINFNAAFLLIHKLISFKFLNNNSSFVFIGSIASKIGIKGNFSYSAYKSALCSAVKVLTVEFASKGYRFNVVSPGMVETAIYHEQVALLSNEIIDNDKKKYPLGYGKPESVANLVVFLLSSHSNWITGQEFVIDGGRSSN